MEYSEVRRQIEEALPDGAFDDRENLLELGLNSLMVMRLVNQWRKQGVKLSFGKLMESPTLESWWKLIEGGGTKKRPGRRRKKEEYHASGPFPLTDVQYAYWAGRDDHQVLGGVGCHAYLEFDGKGIDEERLLEAWNTVQFHHPMLRARFLENGTQEIMQEPYSQKIQIYHFSEETSKEELEKKLSDVREKRAHRKLQVKEGEVAGLALSLLPEHKNRIHVDVDLLVADVQSLSILLRDLASAYAGRSLPSSSHQWDFASYLKKQETEREEEKEQAGEYWRQRLHTLPQGLKLPLAKRPEEMKSVRFKRRILRLSKEDWESLSKRATEYKTTPAMVLLTAYAVVLERWSEAGRFLINIPVFNRNTQEKGIEDAIADFTTLILLEVDCESSPTFRGLLESIQRQMYQDLEHASYSGVQVQRDLAKLRGVQENIAPAVFACNLGTPLVGQEFKEQLGQFTYMISQTPQVWLDFQMYEDERGLMLTWDTVEGLFLPHMIQDMLDSLGTLLKRLQEESWDQVFDVMPESQKKCVQTESRTGDIEHPGCLHEEFFCRAQEEPERTAIVDTGRNLVFTYRELRDRVLLAAKAIAARGISGEAVAVTLPRGFEQIEAVLAVLLSGNCYVPVSQNQPVERRRLICEKTGIRYVITDRQGKEKSGLSKETEVLVLEELRTEVSSVQLPEISPEDLAYIIMTSGSTGLPKGVEITHKSAWNTIADINERYGICREDTALAVSAIDFDLSVYDMFGILGAGGTLVLVPEEKKKDAGFFLSQVQKHRVTVWNSVPALFEMLLLCAEADGSLLPLRAVMLSGDWIGLDLPARTARLTIDCHFIAMGGATEASIWSNIQEVTLPLPENLKSIPYGRPLAHQAYRVVDTKGRDCPCWVRGELWIGGQGVARGYRGDQELTEKKFVEDGLGRWYRTGDNGRFWDDRTIEFLGRQDHQVKIRGHRMELGEIEHVLRQFDGVKNAVADPVGEQRGDKFLAAYVETDFDQDSSLTAAKKAEECMAVLWNGLLKAIEGKQPGNRKKYDEFMAYADCACLNIMQETLHRCGLLEDGKTGERWEQLISRWIHILEENQPSCETSFQSRNGCFSDLNRYLKQLASHTDALLRGAEEPLEVFYGGDGRLAPNELLRLIPGWEDALKPVEEAVKMAAKTPKRKGTVRILEWGTRDVRVSRQILTALDGQKIEYDYADASLFFIGQAKEALKEFPFIEYRILDPELGIDEQGYPMHSYDFIIAYQSMHRTHNAAWAAKQASRLLAPGGILCMQELSKKTYLQEISASLLEEGFRSVTDVRRETGAPILTTDQWEHYLKEQGFFQTVVCKDMSGRSLLFARQQDEVLICTEDSLRAYLQTKLPEYMIPKVYHFMERLPITANGKLDRKRLSGTYREEQPPSKKTEAETKTEKILLEIWRELLNNSHAGTKDNYFTLGGDSLTATKMISRIQKQFGCRVTIGTVFDRPTVKELAAAVDAARHETEIEGICTVTPDPANENLPFPLTDVQYAYWIGRSGLYSLGDVSTHCYFELDAVDLDCKRLEKSFNALIRRHGMMRAVILPDGRQQILPRVPEYEIRVQDLTECTEDEAEKRLQRKRKEMSHQVISTEEWPLFDVRATKLTGKRQRLHISFDNLIFDGWSMFHILSEWTQVYWTQKEEEALSLSFRDYVMGLENMKNTGIYEKDKAYWKERTAEMPPAPDLPLAKREDELTEQRFCRRSAGIPEENWKILQGQAGKIGVTPSVFLMTAYAEVLRMWSFHPDFTINLTQFDRKPLHPETEQLVGDFTTLTLLEAKEIKNSTFTQRARELQSQLLRDLEHSSYSAVEVQRDLKKERGAASGAIMPIVFTSGLGISQWKEGKWLGHLAYNISQTPQVWLDHQVVERDGELCLFWDSVDDLFYPGMLDEMFEAYIGLLNRLAETPELTEKQKNSLIEAEISEERRRANLTEYAYEPETLDGMFLKAADLYESREAVVTTERRLNYRVLREEAYYISRRLKEGGIKPSETVGIMMEKGWEQAVAVCGILFAGAAYLPVDANNPKERIRKILKDSNTKTILVQPEILKRNGWLNEYRCIAVNGQKEPVSELKSENNPHGLAYVIYTSGTTGMPKGVMISHRGAANTIKDINRRYQVSTSDRILGLSNLHFDLSVYDMFGIWSAGGTLVIPDSESAKDPAHWTELMDRENITLWNSVPAFAEMLTEYEEHQRKLKKKTLRFVMMSGDWIPTTLPGRIRTLFKEAEVIAMGGATEASIWSNVFEVPKDIPEDWVSIPYGKPLANQKYYVLDQNLSDRPDWVPGMLYIGGTGVAEGYLHDEKKTKEKFILHPETEERLYCTGDMGRYWPDGNIEFLGRSDHQVKISGYRVELGEIENALESIEGVGHSAAVAVSSGKGLKIAAFIEHTKDCEISCVEEDLRRRIPEYQIPERIIPVEKLPLSGNGKVDREALKELWERQKNHPVKETVTPYTGMQTTILPYFEQILEGPVGIRDGFFSNGGDSLKGIRFINLIRDKLDIDLSLKDLYEYSTPEQMADFIEKGQEQLEEGML